MTPAAQMSELGYTSLLITSGAMNLQSSTHYIL